jgi:nitrate/nitrite transport system permease protein
MKMKLSLSQKAGLLSIGLFAVVLLAWQLATLPETKAVAAGVDPEYAALMGGGAASSASSFPTPVAMAQTLWDKLSDPFYDNGPNDKGIGIQLAYSLARVLAGFFLAAAVAIPLGFAIGNSRVFYQALNPYVQLLKPISPLAWMPLALYTIKDASASAIFVIFICSLWPMLINTAHGVANVRRRRNAGRRHRHRLLRVERVEQPLYHQRAVRHFHDRRRRHGLGQSLRRVEQARRVSGISP